MALGNTPAVARSSYIEPRVITLFEDDVVIDLPDASSQPAVPMRIDGEPAYGEEHGSAGVLLGGSDAGWGPGAPGVAALR